MGYSIYCSTFKEAQKEFEKENFTLLRIYQDKYALIDNKTQKVFPIIGKEIIVDLVDELTESHLCSGFGYNNADYKKYLEFLEVTGALGTKIYYDSYIEDGGIEHINNITNYYVTHNYDNEFIVREEEWL